MQILYWIPIILIGIFVEDSIDIIRWVGWFGASMFLLNAGIITATGSGWAIGKNRLYEVSGKGALIPVISQVLIFLLHVYFLVFKI